MYCMLKQNVMYVLYVETDPVPSVVHGGLVNCLFRERPNGDDERKHLTVVV